MGAKPDERCGNCPHPYREHPAMGRGRCTGEVIYHPSAPQRCKCSGFRLRVKTG